MNPAITHEEIQKHFAGAADFAVRPLRSGGFSLMAYAIDGLTSGGDISDYVFRPIAEILREDTMEKLYDAAYRGTIYNSVVSECKNAEDAALKLVNGFCVVLFPGVGALAFETKTADKRSPSPPAVENTVKGPKDAFVETVRSNTSLVRRHLRTPQLRLWETQVGRRSITNVSVLWIEGITNPSLVDRMKKRIAGIDIDGLLSPSAVEEYLTGSRATAFPLIQYTERADTFCKGILDGRVGLLVDGLPLGYLAPVDIGYLMDSPEDRSRDYLSATAVKLLRYTALVADLILPGLYVAFAMHHGGMLSEELNQTIQTGIAKTPFSAGGETVGILIAFELLQESGIHLPQSIGQAVSTIGGIVVGSAAVEAGLISPVALIVISVAGVCGFVIPNRDLATAIRLWRFVLVIGSWIGGLWGMGAGLLLLTLHVIRLRSMGLPYISIRRNELFRPRLKNQKWRNRKLNPLDEKNQK